MKNINIDTHNLVFAGLAKDCLPSLQKNLDFISKFNAELPGYNLRFIVVESDSTDGTKEYLENVNFDFLEIITADNLDKKFKYRTERIANCRNMILDKLKNEKSNQDLIYIPIDLDIEIFEYQDIHDFHFQLNDFIENKLYDAYFPFNFPYYYDIHALRSKGWNSHNPWEKIKKINKFIFIGKFFVRYFYVYRIQKKYNTKKELINVESAFGGIGFYKLNNSLLEIVNYEIEIDLGNTSCEHLKFNSFFRNKAVVSRWKVPSPKEHVEYKLLSFKEKSLYILTSIRSDLKNLFN
jgi:hypothetical protein